MVANRSGNTSQREGNKMSIASALDSAKSNAIAALSSQKKTLSTFTSEVQGKLTPFATVVQDLLDQVTPKSLPASAIAAPVTSAKQGGSVTGSAIAGANPTASQNNSFFYGYNGQSYSLAPPTGDSFLASNGQTYTKQQIKDFYARNQNPGDDVAEMAKLGLKAPDLYKARFRAGQTDTNGSGIYSDPKEMVPYDDYLRGAMAQLGGVSGAMSFDQWRNTKDPSYLASLQTGPNDNVGWINGPAGGVAVGGATTRA
jgi:hypothetical protein